MAATARLWEQYSEKNPVRFVREVGENTFHGFERRSIFEDTVVVGHMEKLVREHIDMTTSLLPGIFLRVQEDGPDLMKSMIVGSEGTPHEGGWFGFDIFCPMEYPDAPPKLKCRIASNVATTQHADSAHITGPLNASPHNNGKTCLSLLGAWPGPAEARWDPCHSGLLQILISFQSMISVDKPWFNEPDSDTLNPLSPYAVEELRRNNMEVQSIVISYAMLRDLEHDEGWKGL